MPSAKRFPGSKFWSACYKIPTGQKDRNGQPIFKRIQRSTKLTDKDQALQLAISLERAAVAAAQQCWNEQGALRLIQELKVLTNVSVSQVEETEGFLRNWLKSIRPNVAVSSFKNATTAIEDFIAFLDPRRNRPLFEINTTLIEQFRDQQRAEGRAIATVNKALSFLRQAFEVAVRRDALAKNPALGTKYKGSKKAAQKREHFTLDQFQALLEVTAPGNRGRTGHEVTTDWQTFIVTSGYTGARQQEVAQLLWANVHWDRDTVVLPREKNDDEHQVPMHPTLRAHLRAKWEALADKSEALVMPELASQPGRALSKVFRETILPRIGIVQPYTKRKQGCGRTLAKHSIHSLRHSLATWLDEAGVPEDQRMQIIGHDDVDVNRNYTHAELKRSAAQLAKVPSVNVP